MSPPSSPPSPGRPRAVEVRAPGAAPLVVVVVDRLRIGRSGDGLMVGDPLLSRQHCELRVEGGLLVLEDLGSSHGTRCNGAEVDRPTVVGEGDVVVAGATTLRIDPAIPGWAPAAAPPPPPPPVPPVPSPARTGSRPAGSPPGAEATMVLPGGPLGQAATSTLAASVVGGTLTIAFSDIVDSTALTSRLGDRAWFAALQRHNQVLRSRLGPHHGREVKGQGDGFMLSFPSAHHGADWAVDVQRALERARAEDPDWPVHVRIGLHTGEVIREGGDIFGWHVNLAARIAATAGSDEVVASSLVRDLLGPVGDVSFGPPRPVELKGIPGTHQVHPLQWHDQP